MSGSERGQSVIFNRAMEVLGVTSSGVTGKVLVGLWKSDVLAEIQ